MPKTDQDYMAMAIASAKNGEGVVEPNPMVGCVLVSDDQVIGIGWHEKFGGPHAEIDALNSVKPEHQNRIQGATAYVSLEPCSHHGKTGPCCDALIAAKISRVVVAVTDPNPQVAGQGIARMRAAGIEVATDVLQIQATDVLAPYLKRTRTGLPWVIAKWAMTVDGNIATAHGDSKWISNEQSRQRVHAVRRRVDAVLVGIGTALADDPMLNPRPAGNRTVTRVVVDSAARISLDSKLVQTATELSTLIAVDPEHAAADRIDQLEAAGCKVWQAPTGLDANGRLLALLRHLGEQGATNVLVEGGGQILGALNDAQQIDEIHVFTGAQLLGGANSLSPVLGSGQNIMSDALQLRLLQVEKIENDIHAIYRR